MRLQSLSSRLFAVTAVALVPAVLIAISNIVTIQRDRIADLHRDALRTAALVSLEVDQTVTGMESVLRTLAAAPIVRTSDPACSGLMADAVSAVPFIAQIYIQDPDGSIRCSSVPPGGLDKAPAELVAKATAGRPLAGLFQLGQSGGAPRLPVVLRIGERVGEAPGVAVAHLDLAWMQHQLQRRALVRGSSMAIVDQSGIILAGVPDPEGLVGTRIQSHYMHLIKKEAPGTLEIVSRDGTPRILGYYPPAATGSGLHISSGFAIGEGLETIHTVALQGLGLALLGTALASILAFYTARVFIARPVGVLIDTITSWRSGNTAARTGMSAENGEIGDAGAALDAFLNEVLINRDARKKADEARDLMRDELEHREKNLLATIQAVARQTFSNTGNDAALRVFRERLNAISEANRMLKQSGWTSMPLRDLIASGVATFIGENHDRVEAKGPDLVVKGNVATAIAMSIHELSTNAVKYGALSTDSGRILIEWAVEPGEKGGVFTLLWTERGGPPVMTPDHTGFGSKVIRHALSAQTGGTVEIRHDPKGLVCRLTAPAAAVIAPQGAQTGATEAAPGRSDQKP